MASVKIALDNLPEDARIEVPYLGEFTNNTTTTVDDDRWDVFLYHQQSEQEAERLREADELVISTAVAEQVSESLNEIRAAADERTLDEYKKDELIEMAHTLNIPDADNLLKAQLVKAIEAASASQPQEGR